MESGWYLQTSLAFRSREETEPLGIMPRQSGPLPRAPCFRGYFSDPHDRARSQEVRGTYLSRACIPHLKAASWHWETLDSLLDWPKPTSRVYVVLTPRPILLTTSDATGVCRASGSSMRWKEWMQLGQADWNSPCAHGVGEGETLLRLSGEDPT